MKKKELELFKQMCVETRERYPQPSQLPVYFAFACAFLVWLVLFLKVIS